MKRLVLAVSILLAGIGYITFSNRQLSEADLVSYNNFVSGLVDKSDAGIALAIANQGTDNLQARGLVLFEHQCARCHGTAYKIPKHTPIELLNIINNGLPNKGMPAWGHILTKQQLALIASYVIKAQREIK